MAGLLIADAEVGGRRVDVRVARGRIEALAARLRPLRNEDVVAANGAALLPGLHDHHLHLHAMAAQARSVDCRRPDIVDLQTFATALRAVANDGEPLGWVRAVAYHEDIAGDLDRSILDGLMPDRPVRVQHRTGSLWMLNTPALRTLRLDDNGDGRLWRSDAQVREVDAAPPDLTAVGRELASYGITGVTDATPDLDRRATANIAEASAQGRVPQQVHLLGASEVDASARRVTHGPVKLLLADHDLPPLGDLVDAIRGARRQDRGVAVHCVTREALVLTVLALEEAGAHADDRIEHGAVVPTELHRRLATLGAAVVTQPGFVRERGDTYLRDVAPDDIDLLYPYASLQAAGIPVAPSSDAPFGAPDPWQVIAAATTRRTVAGAILGAQEQVPAQRVLTGYLSRPDDPGGAPRQVGIGMTADLCLLRVPLSDALCDPSRDLVRLVLADGHVIHEG